MYPSPAYILVIRHIYDQTQVVSSSYFHALILKNIFESIFSYLCVCLQEVVIGLTERYRLYANDIEVGCVLNGIFGFKPNATCTTSGQVGS